MTVRSYGDGPTRTSRFVDSMDTSQIGEAGRNGAKGRFSITHRFQKNTVLVQRIGRIVISRRPNFRLLLDSVLTIKTRLKSTRVVQYAAAVCTLT